MKRDFRERPGELDSGRPAPDHDEREPGLLLLRIGFALRGFESEKDAAIGSQQYEYAAELRAAEEKTGLDESVITGEGLMRGRRVAVVACEFRFLAGSIGVAAAIIRLLSRFDWLPTLVRLFPSLAGVFPDLVSGLRSVTEMGFALSLGILSGYGALVATAIVETFIGLTLITGKLLRAGLLVLGGAMVGILSPLVLHERMQRRDVIAIVVAMTGMALFFVGLDGTELSRAELGYVAPGARRLRLSNPSDERARVVLLGGEPFEEQIVMWWNFVGRSHDEIAAFREAWQSGSDRFGGVEGYAGEPQRLPAPPLPNARIKPRLNPPGPGDRSAWG